MLCVAISFSLSYAVPILNFYDLAELEDEYVSRGQYVLLAKLGSLIEA